MKRKSARQEYAAQFYRKNRLSFAIALISSVMIAALNLWVAWVVQQMIDCVSNAPGALTLHALTWQVAAVVASILALKAVSYASKPRFMEKAMRQYRNYAFQKLTKKSISAFCTENTAN